MVLPKTRVRFDPEKRCFKIGQIPLRGAAKHLAETYWSHYSYARQHHGSSFGGLARGTMVDKQLTAWAKTGALAPDLHPYARRAIKAMARWGWKPVGAQYCVGSLPLRLGTAIDMVVEDARGRRFLLEIKTGMDTWIAEAQGALREPFEFIPNSPLNHALLQLAVGLLLAPEAVQRTVYRCYVVQLTEAAIKRHLCPKWAKKAAKGMLERSRGRAEGTRPKPRAS
jgi:hypothetical protein